MKTFLMLFVAAASSMAFAAPSPNDHFSCFATLFYGRLQVEVQQSPKTVTVKLAGFDAAGAAQKLGIATGGHYVETLAVDFPKEWCNASPKLLGVVNCQIPSWQWPRPTLPIKAIDRDGAEVGHDVVSIYDFRMEKTRRISATATGDHERERIELDAYLISETDNAKRAKLQLPYQPTDCKAR